MEQNHRYTRSLDDMDKTRFGQHGTALIKDDHVRMKQYPSVVLSMNAGKDNRTRVPSGLWSPTLASLSDPPARREGSAGDKQIKTTLGTALYREYRGGR